MTAEQIRAVRDANPFRPFTIHLADGRSLPVGHRDFLLMSPSGRIITVYNADDSCNIVDALLITDLEIAASAGSPTGS
jgi:hypothetical protein